METHVFLQTDRDNFINSLIACESDFILKQTNYSNEIIFDGTRFLINNKGYNDFSVLKFRSKILSDIKHFELKNRPPKTIDKQTINYFDLGKYVNKGGNLNIEKCFCIDISGAYPTTFKNKNYITEKTFNELSEVNKIVRLKACGSIATEKIIYNFRRGVCIESELKKSEYANYFFDVVKTVSKCMGRIAQSLNKDFLFYWVDGIFFNGEGNIKQVCQLLDSYSYKYKIETVESMKIIKEKRHLFIDLIKDGKKKIFNLPLVYKKRIKFAE